MTNLGEEADAYQPDTVKSVTFLPFISIDMEVQEDNEVEYPYKYVLVEGERYKITKTVLAAIKDIRSENSNITKFKVKSSGEGKKTKYTVIPLN